jgi:hypothetical protein
MEHDAYLAGIAELYAAEVLGEGLASRWLELSAVPSTINAHWHRVS